jgi:hypothetical protein
VPDARIVERRRQPVGGNSAQIARSDHGDGEVGRKHGEQLARVADGIELIVPVAHVVSRAVDGRGNGCALEPLLELPQNVEVTEAFARLRAAGGFDDDLFQAGCVDCFKNLRDGVSLGCVGIQLWIRRWIEQEGAASLLECRSQRIRGLDVCFDKFCFPETCRCAPLAGALRIASDNGNLLAATKQ